MRLRAGLVPGARKITARSAFNWSICSRRPGRGRCQYWMDTPPVRMTMLSSSPARYAGASPGANAKMPVSANTGWALGACGSCAYRLASPEG